MTETVTSRISDDLYEQLEEYKNERDLSRSETIAMFIAHGVDADLDYETQGDYLQGAARLEARVDGLDERIGRLDKKIDGAIDKIDKIRLWPISLWILILFLVVWVLWGI